MCTLQRVIVLVFDFGVIHVSG